jgi:hypothetical protein
MNYQNTKAFVEVTFMAGILFALPVGYYHGRPYLLQAQDKLYKRCFGISEE